MPRILTNSTIPSNDKTFFRNYVDHLKFEVDGFGRDFDINPDDATSYMIVRQMNISVPLRDGHDYMDEVMGASVWPLFGALIVVGGLVMAVYGGLTALAVCSGLTEEPEHPVRVWGYLELARVALALAVASLIKSVISLFSRPLITAFKGWALPDEERFSREDYVEQDEERFSREDYVEQPRLLR